MHKVIRKSEAAIRQIAEKKIARNYITKALSPQVSLAVTEATDYYEQETTEYDRIYYVLEGELLLVFDNEEVHLGTEDSCFVARDTAYEMRGTLKALMINQPAFGTIASKENSCPPHRALFHRPNRLKRLIFDLSLKQF